MLAKLLCFLAIWQISLASNLIFYQEGISATLECTGDGDVQYWFLKGQEKAIDETSTEGVFMHPNGTLEFREVKKEHHGTHMCVTMYNEEYYLHNVDMKVRFLPPDNLWEARYKRMFITGLTAAIVCFLIFAGICLVNKYRWRDPEPTQKSHLVKESYENPGMINDETITVRM